MGADLSEFQRENALTSGMRCKFRQAVHEQLDDQQRDALAEALADPTLKHSAIARVVSRWLGHTVAGLTIGRHRGDVQCVTCSADPWA